MLGLTKKIQTKINTSQAGPHLQLNASTYSSV